MQPEIVTAIIGLIGLIIGAVPTYLFMRQRGTAEIDKLKAETEKTKAEAEKIRAELRGASGSGNKTKQSPSIQPGDNISLGKKILHTGPHCVYQSLRTATPDILKACKEAEVIKIFANKGIVFIGTDDSIISTAEIKSYLNLRKIQVVLLSPDSRWISKGFITLRKHESLEIYLNDLKASHLIAETGMRKFATRLPSTRSGVKYFTGEPCWRLVMTEKTAFVSNYADEKNPQARDLPVCRFDNLNGSFYSAFKRYFNNIWHNESKPGSFMQSIIDFSVSAGGVVYADIRSETYVLILRRHDGFWVLPKGHKKLDDGSLEATAIREVSEEAGLPISHLKVEERLEVYTDTTYEHKVVHLFSIQYRGTKLPTVHPDADHAEARWCPISQLPSPMLYPYQAATVSEFAERHAIVKKPKSA